MDNSNLVKVEWSLYRDKCKQAIDNIGIKAKDHDLFTKIDKACSNEWAFLFLAPDGFIILRPKINNSTNYIEIMAAYCDGGHAIKRYETNIINLAKHVNAEYLEFLTVRKGYQRVLSHWHKCEQYKQFAVWRYFL